VTAEAGRLFAAVRAGPWRSAIGRVLAGNVLARLAALLALALATVLVARVGGPDLVGGFTLLRVLPGLVGVLAAILVTDRRRYLSTRRLRLAVVPS